jgi:hypothetical protein
MVMKIDRRLLFLAAIFAVIWGCSPDRIGLAGGGSGTETVGGCALDDEQKPAAGIVVSLRRSDFLDTGSISLVQDPDILQADTTTDINGNFSLLLGTTGRFIVAMYDKNGNAAQELCAINQDETLFVKATLRETGVLSGKINQESGADQTRFNIYFYGFARHSVMTDDSGNFKVPNLPEGKYRFKVIPQIPIYKPYEGSVSVVSGESTDMPAIVMQKGDFGIHPSDSAVVRAILDSNGLQAVPIDKIAKSDASWPHKVVELSINNLKRNNMYFRLLTSRVCDLAELQKIDISNNVMMTQLPKEIGKLKHLSELVLRNNRISYLPPEIGALASLRKLDVSKNTFNSGSGFLSLPNEIGNLDSLEYLYVDTNNLTELTPGIGNCRILKILSVSGCKLKTLPGELAKCTSLQLINAQNNLIDSLPLEITVLGSSFEHAFINFNYNDFCQLNQNQIPMEIFAWLDHYSTNPKWRSVQNCNFYCIPEKNQ